MKNILILLALIISIPAMSQNIALKAYRFLDLEEERIIDNPIILVEDDVIKEINPKVIPNGFEVIDLGNVTLMPGFIDLHTHILSLNSSEYDKDLTERTPIYRALRATNNLRIALKNGVTTIRDVSSEGADYADVDLKHAAAAQLFDAPRMYVSGAPLAGFGQGPPIERTRSQNWFHKHPLAFKGVSGEDDCRKSVREHFSRGVDWIKVYVDWDRVTMTMVELEAIVDEANRLGLKVAAHAQTVSGAEAAAKAKVHTIEHGNKLSDKAIELIVENNIVLVPTLTVAFQHLEKYPEYVESWYNNLRKAYQKKVIIAMGTDAGSYDWTKIPQSTELILYVNKIGMNSWEAIKSGTTIPSSVLGVNKELGLIKENYKADLIAVRGNPIEQIETVKDVIFVMRDGKIIINNANKH